MKTDIEAIEFRLGTQQETDPEVFTLTNKRIIGMVLTTEVQPDYTAFYIRSGGKTFFPIAIKSIFIDGAGKPLRGFTLPQPPALFSTYPVKNHLFFELDFMMEGPPYRLSIGSSNGGMGWGVTYCVLFLTTNDLDFYTQAAEKIQSLRLQLEKLFGNEFIMQLARGEISQTMKGK